VPAAWWDQYAALAEQKLDLGIMMARVSLAPYTWTESMKMLEPIGVDRLPYELNLKHGMRDGFTCPVGARWVVAYWSPKVLTHLSEQARALLFMAASFAAIRLERLVGPDPKRLGHLAVLTPRERAVLRLLSLGKRTGEIAAHLELGEETVRSHIKKAQAKLGVKDRTHAVAEAMRQHLIP
jgi:LuxR family quorum sensing-dependent transcriptional regulator